MEYILIAVLIGLIPAYIAWNKGRSFVAWWVYGTLLWIVALPHALVIKPDREFIEKQQMSEGMKKCPSCAEMVKAEAIVCRYCGRALVIDEPERPLETPPPVLSNHPIVILGSMGYASTNQIKTSGK
jgi:hypothetical protein